MPQIINRTEERVHIDNIEPHPANPNDGDVAAIAESIEQNGFYGRIVVRDSTGKILAGEHRWRAAQEVGLSEVPIERVECDDETAMRILLADNRTAEKAEREPDPLADLLQELEQTDDGLTGTGYDGGDLDGLLDDLGRIPGEEVDDPGAETSRAEELQEEWGTERGQLWRIGDHRLLCGDATDEHDVERLLNGAEPNLMVTDPPYGVEYTGGTKEREGLEADDRGTSIYADFLHIWSRHLHKKAPLYLWHAGAVSMPVMEALEQNGWEVRSQIIWAKNHAQFGALGAQYKQKHEPCFYCFRDPPFWYGPNNAVTVWEHDRAASNDHHPTQKPPEVMGRAIQNSSQRGDEVVDCFAGGGSTVIAAENEGRTCYAMEIDPGYCAVILERCSEAGLECEQID